MSRCGQTSVLIHPKTGRHSGHFFYILARAVLLTSMFYAQGCYFGFETASEEIIYTIKVTDSTNGKPIPCFYFDTVSASIDPMRLKENGIATMPTMSDPFMNFVQDCPVSDHCTIVVDKQYDSAIWVYAKGYSMACFRETNAPRKQVHKTIALEPGAGSWGIVVDAQGNPVPDANVYFAYNPKRTDFTGALVSGTTDAQGQFWIPKGPVAIGQVYAQHSERGSGRTVLNCNEDEVRIVLNAAPKS